MTDPSQEFRMKNAPEKYEITIYFVFPLTPDSFRGQGLFVYFSNSFILIRFQSSEILFNPKSSIEIDDFAE